MTHLYYGLSEPSIGYFTATSSIITRLSFDASGNLAVAGTVQSDGTGLYGLGPAGTQNLVVQLWSVNQLMDSAYWDVVGVGHATVRYIFGSAFDDVWGGIEWVRSADLENDPSSSQLAISGYTKNAVPGKRLNFTAWSGQDGDSPASKILPDSVSSWFAVINGPMSDANATVWGGGTWGTANVKQTITSMARDPATGDFLVGGGIMGTTPFTPLGTSGSYDAYAMRISPRGDGVRWVSAVLGSDFNEEVRGVFFHAVPVPPTYAPRLRATIIGNYNKTNVWGGLSASPALFKQFGMSGGTDAFTMSLDGM